MEALTLDRTSTATHACTACRGTGTVTAYRHRLPNRIFNARRQGYKRYTCPSCQGSGKSR